MERNICKVCDTECTETLEKICCKGPCSRKFHWKCVGFTPAVIKFFRTSNNLQFECDDCRYDPTGMIGDALQKILSFMCILDERLNRQESNSDKVFKNFENLDNKILMLSNEKMAETNKKLNAVNADTAVPFIKTVKKPVIDPVVLVKPKTKQKCSATRADLNKKNIPIEIALSVNNMPEGAVAIECNSKNEQSKVHEKAKKELSEDYVISIPKLRNPKIRVTNLSEKLRDDQIILGIKESNEFAKDSDMKVLNVYEIKYNETFGAIIEVDVTTFDHFMRVKKIAVGRDLCNVTESVNVLRCYKCCGFNHKSNICKNQKACLRCGGQHEMKECRATKYACINCKVANEKLKVNIDCNHPAWSRLCTVWQQNIEKEKNRTKTRNMCDGDPF